MPGVKTINTFHISLLSSGEGRVFGHQIIYPKIDKWSGLILSVDRLKNSSLLQKIND